MESPFIPFEDEIKRLNNKLSTLQNVFDEATSELYKWGSENVGDNSDFWDIWVKFKRFDGDAK
jgi:hypothetical protein